MKKVLIRFWNTQNSVSTAPMVFFLALFFLAGAVAGSLFAAYTGSGNEDGLVKFVSGYLSVLKSNSGASLFFDSIVKTYQYPLLVFLFGLSVVGVFFIPVSMAVKGFMLTYSITSFVRIFGAKGLLLASCVLGIQNLFIIPCMFILGAQGFVSSSLLLSLSSGKGKKLSGSVFAGGYYLRSLICAAALFACALIEAFLTPMLVSLVSGYIW